MAEPLAETLRQACEFVVIGLPSAIMRTAMKKGRTWRDVVANAGSAMVVAPLAGFAAEGLGLNNGLVFVVVGVATLMGSDLVAGAIKLGEEFKKDPRGTSQAWIDFWRGKGG